MFSNSRNPKTNTFHTLKEHPLFIAKLYLKISNKNEGHSKEKHN